MTGAQEVAGRNGCPEEAPPGPLQLPARDGRTGRWRGRIVFGISRGHENDRAHAGYLEQNEQENPGPAKTTGARRTCARLLREIEFMRMGAGRPGWELPRLARVSNYR